MDEDTILTRIKAYGRLFHIFGGAYGIAALFRNTTADQERTYVFNDMEVTIE